MKIASVELKQSPFRHNFVSEKTDAKICFVWVFGIFHIPKSCKALRFEVHTTPNKDRFAFGLTHRTGLLISHEPREQKARICCYDPFTYWLREKGCVEGKIYYAEVWY